MEHFWRKQSPSSSRTLPTFLPLFFVTPSLRLGLVYTPLGWSSCLREGFWHFWETTWWLASEGPGSTRSPPATLHRPKHLTAYKIPDGRRGLADLEIIRAFLAGGVNALKLSAQKCQKLVKNLPKPVQKWLKSSKFGLKIMKSLKSANYFCQLR